MTPTKIILRWNMGDFKALSWRALEYSIRLMQRLEPDAEYHVVHQGPILVKVDGVTYHPQDAGLGVRGHHYPPRFDIEAHEVWLDNDHIMWELPAEWAKFKKSNSLPLIWAVNWDYYGAYTGHFTCPYQISSGIWGLPPGGVIPPSYIPDSVEGDDMGWVAMHLAAYPEYAKITIQEVNCYQPAHVCLGPQWSTFGTHGVHLVGMNREWNGNAKEALDRIKETYEL